MNIPRQRRSAVALDMSPLIDCVFLLLVFFMLSSSFVTPAIRLDLPNTTSQSSPQKQGIAITIDADGVPYLNKNKVTFDDLPAQLALLLEAEQEQSVTIRGDENMKYANFVKALEIASNSGSVHVNVAHDWQKDSP